MFNLWKHPKTDEERFYFTPKLIESALTLCGKSWDAKTVKIWASRGNDGWGIRASVKMDEPVSPDDIAILARCGQQAAGLTGDETWEQLSDLAEDKKGAAGESPTKTHSTAGDHLDAGHPDDNKRRFVESQKLKISTIKMPGNVVIEIDHRETKLMVELLKAHPQITVKRENLEIADFRIKDQEGNELLVERKRCNTKASKTDFESSISDGGRLFDQAERLRFITDNSDHHIIPVILLEGNVYANAASMLCQQIDGAISFLAGAQRISVLSSYNPNHSAYVIAKLAGHFLSNNLENPMLDHRNKPRGLFLQKRYLLASLPGISTVMAESLLEHFGSVRAVANASEKELALVKGVGQKRCREIVRVMSEL